MNRFSILVLCSLLVYCRAGGPAEVDSGTADPVCDPSDQIDFQVCMSDCYGNIPDVYSANARDDEDVLIFLSCLAHCHLDPLRPLGRPGPGTPAELDDSLKYTICYNKCYKDWVDGTLTSDAASCFKNEYLALTLCFYTCVKGVYGPPGPPAVVSKRSVAVRSKRAVDTQIKTKIEYVQCYVNCYDKSGFHSILEAIGGVTSAPTCTARDTTTVGRCNAMCYDRAVNPVRRKKRATDAATTKDRLNTSECVAFCLKTSGPNCVFDLILAVQICVDQCLDATYPGSGAGPAVLIPQ